MTCDEGFEDGISRSLRLKEGCHRVQRRACMFVMSVVIVDPPLVLSWISTWRKSREKIRGIRKDPLTLHAVFRAV